MKKLQEKWDNVNHLVVHSTTSKEKNNKLVYEKLKKDFTEFFNKDLFGGNDTTVN